MYHIQGCICPEDGNGCNDVNGDQVSNYLSTDTNVRPVYRQEVAVIPAYDIPTNYRFNISCSPYFPLSRKTSTFKPYLSSSAADLNLVNLMNYYNECIAEIRINKHGENDFNWKIYLTMNDTRRGACFDTLVDSSTATRIDPGQPWPKRTPYDDHRANPNPYSH